MDPGTSRKITYAAVIALPLLFVSCNRQSVTARRQAEPPAAEEKSVDATTQSVPVGTSGTAPAPVSTGTAPAVTAPAATAADTPATSSVASDRDADAIQALEEMGSYLRTLRTFQVRSETSRDEVLGDGQAVEFGGVVDMIVARPNRLRAEVTTDKQQRLYFDDGKTFNVWARRVNYYATIPAPPTLRELADKLSDEYDLELPLADLFYWGERQNTHGIVGAVDIGASQIDGTTCEHYAFRQDGADWQVWIQQGDYPLPRKLVISTTTDSARPRFTSVMTWNLAPSFNDAAFTFVPPKDARRIMMAEAPSGDSGR